MSQPPKVVFDCNIFLQALANPQGPSGRCVALALESRVSLFLSPQVLDEVRDVTTRPKLIAKFRLRPERVQFMLENLPRVAIVLPAVSNAWTYERDPDDAHYVNLALSAEAGWVISRDKDLLDLMTSSSPEATEFRRRWPALRIADPVTFLDIFVPHPSIE